MVRELAVQILAEVEDHCQGNDGGIWVVDVGNLFRILMDGCNALRNSHGGSRLQKHCLNGTGIIALVTLSARASWYTLMDASVIIGTPADTSKQTGKIGGKGGPASLHAVCIYVVFF